MIRRWSGRLFEDCRDATTPRRPPLVHSIEIETASRGEGAGARLRKPAACGSTGRQIWKNRGRMGASACHRVRRDKAPAVVRFGRRLHALKTPHDTGPSAM